MLVSYAAGCNYLELYDVFITVITFRLPLSDGHKRKKSAQTNSTLVQIKLKDWLKAQWQAAAPVHVGMAPGSLGGHTAWLGWGLLGTPTACDGQLAELRTPEKYHITNRTLEGFGFFKDFPSVNYCIKGKHVTSLATTCQTTRPCVDGVQHGDIRSSSPRVAAREDRCPWNAGTPAPAMPCSPADTRAHQQHQHPFLPEIRFPRPAV